MSVLELEDPDILCLQETKCSETKLPDELKNVKGYKSYFVEGLHSLALSSFISKLFFSHLNVVLLSIHEGNLLYNLIILTIPDKCL